MHQPFAVGMSVLLQLTAAALTGAVLLQTAWGEEPAKTDSAPPAFQPPKSVLFVGNSYTYFNDLPAMVQAMAAARERKVDVDQVTPGGVTLEQHVEKTGAIDKIRSRKWDVIVLQEHSLRPIQEPAAMLESARTLCEESRKQGARVVFYLTWARQKTPETQEKLCAAYFNVAEKLSAEVAPVGVAWQQALKSVPGKSLHTDDGSHPNPEGSYLAACTFFATLFHQSPVGLPAELKKGNQVLITLSAERAKELQTLAAEAIEQRAKK